MMLYLRTLVVANSQQRPLLFWFVIGPVLNLSSWLKTCESATTALRDLSAEWRSVWLRMVRASSTWGLLAISSSHELKWVEEMLPSAEAGFEDDEIASLAKSALMRFSLSSGAAAAAAAAGDLD